MNANPLIVIADKEGRTFMQLIDNLTQGLWNKFRGLEMLLIERTKKQGLRPETERPVLKAPQITKTLQRLGQAGVNPSSCTQLQSPSS